MYLGLTNNKNLFLLFLTLACVSGIGSFFVPALLCLIIYYVKNRSELKQDICSLEKFKTTIFFMILFLGFLLVSWAITLPNRLFLRFICDSPPGYACPSPIRPHRTGKTPPDLNRSGGAVFFYQYVKSLTIC